MEKIKSYQAETAEDTGFAKVLANKWYVDELYDAIIVRPLRSLSAFFNNVIERSGIDGFVNGVGRGINYSSRQVRLLQNGQVGSYILMMVIGIIVLFIIQIFRKIILMLGKYITFPELLLWFPLVTGLVAFFIKDQKKVKAWALFSSLITVSISVISLCYTDNTKYFLYNYVSYVWLQYLGSSFAVGLDGMGHLLTFLTAISFPLIFAATYKNDYKKSNTFYGLMLLSQAGLMGVFVAIDALVFYFFWELALIPVYFLCSRWGGERRIQATWKFFIYTFAAHY